MTASSRARDEDMLHLDNQLCFPLYAATNLLQRLYRPLLKPLGLTYSQYLVMLVLWERKEVLVGELCDCLHLDVGTLSPLLKRMQEAGLIVRRRDAADERRVFAAPTAHGLALHDEARRIPEALAKRTGLAAEEGEKLRDQVQAFVVKLAGAI